MTGLSGVLVYHIPETRSERVVWLLEELGAPYEVRRLSYRDRDVKKAGFLAINPFGMVPTISVDGAHIRETSAIFEYLLGRQKHGLSLARSDPGYVDYLAWLHSAEPTLFPGIVDHVMHAEVLPEAERIPEMARRGRERWSEHLGILDRTLSDRDYIAGDHFTAADILVGHVLRMAKAAGLLPSSAAEHAGAYLARLEARPAYRRMLAA